MKCATSPARAPFEESTSGALWRWDDLVIDADAWQHFAAQCKIEGVSTGRKLEDLMRERAREEVERMRLHGEPIPGILLKFIGEE